MLAGAHSAHSPHSVLDESPGPKGHSFDDARVAPLIGRERMVVLGTFMKATLIVAVTLHLILLASVAMRGMFAGGLPFLAVHVVTILMAAASVASMRLKSKRENERLQSQIELLQKDLTLAEEQLTTARQNLLLAQESSQTVLRHDKVTGALTMEAFLEEVNREIDSSRRTEIPICMLIIQADHSDGSEETLRNLALVLGERIRTSDRMAAVSHDQLAILLHNTTIDVATPVCEGFVGWIHKELNLSVSAGMSELVINRDRAGTLLSRTRQALEHARANGGDKLSVIPSGAPIQRLHTV